MPREDYKEMMELCLLILGKPVCSNDESYHFQIPGAYYLARWIGKVIYCFKIYLFRHQFKLTPAETRHLLEICLFSSHIIIRQSMDQLSNSMRCSCERPAAVPSDSTVCHCIQTSIWCCKEKAWTSFMVSWTWAHSTVSLMKTFPLKHSRRSVKRCCNVVKTGAIAESNCKTARNWKTKNCTSW